MGINLDGENKRKKISLCSIFMMIEDEHTIEFLDGDLLSPDAREVLELARRYSIDSPLLLEEQVESYPEQTYVQLTSSFSSEPHRQTDHSAWLRDHFLAWTFLQRIRAPLRRLSNFLVDINTLLDQETEDEEFGVLNVEDKENVPPEGQN